MNRVLLLLLSVLTINLFGNVLAPETAQNNHAVAASESTIAPQKLTKNTAVASLSRPMMDTVPPVITCPNPILVQVLTQGRCDTVVTYSVTATDDQGPAIVIQLSGLTSGSVFPIGSSTAVFLATDLSGNTATCSFSITVDDTDISLTCDDLFLVQLDTNCSYTVLPQEILEGGPYGCWNRFISEVDRTVPFGNGPWLPATFGVSDLGQTYQIRITDFETNNKCWGNVRIEDTLAPIMTCPEVIISCAETMFSPQYLLDSLGIMGGIPQVMDACGPSSPPEFVDLTVNTYNCDSMFTDVISRRWQTMDESDNISTCIQKIKLRRHTLADLQIPADITLSCPDINTLPAVTGMPFVMENGKRYEMANSSLCDLSAFYEDFPIALPCGDTQVERNWEFFDFCTGVTEGPFIQNIYLRDQTGPIVTCPPALTVSLTAVACKASVELPDVILDDVCSPLALFQAFWEENGLAETLIGTLADFPGNDLADFDTLGVLGMASLPIGTTTITYVAEDDCGNIGDCSFSLTVADLVPPVALCDTLTNIELTEEGLVAFPAGAFDNGSTDDCAPLSFKIKLRDFTPCLYDTVWTDTLRLCCLNQNDTLDAFLRVYDVPVPMGIVPDSFGMGHFSECLLQIAITDPNPPTCMAPANVTVDCENFDPTLESYGGITFASCAVDSLAIELDYTAFDTNCTRGVITRIFKVYDEAGNPGGCAQSIKVDSLPNNYFVKFPDDLVLTMCDGSNLYGEPEMLGKGCEDFEVTFTDELFTVVPDACFKIERIWKISNNCNFISNVPLINIPNPNPNPITNNAANLPGPIVSALGTPSPWTPTNVKINPTDPQPTNYSVFYNPNSNGYQYKQIIKFIDGQAPAGVFTTPTCANQTWTTSNNPQFWHEMYWYDPVTDQKDLCEEPTELSITVTDACSGSNVNIEYLLFLDLDANGTRETVINSLQLGTNGLGWNNVRYNNLNTPNYSGGTARQFDERPVPGNQKMGFAIQESISGNERTASVRWNTQQQPSNYFPPELPHGTHAIQWFVSDQCGNNAEYQHTFTVKDCKPPTLECLPAPTFNIPATRSLVLQAEDLLGFSEDNCTPADLITYGVRICGGSAGFPLNSQGNPNTTVTFNCDSLGPQCVEVWAMDKAGNSDFCVTTLSLEDNQHYCASGPDGTVKTELGAGVDNVTIEVRDLNPFIPPFSPAIMTDTLGSFYVPTLPASTLSLAPSRNDNPLNGVTTFDLVLISKHILGSEPLNSPYKMIAADGNKSGSITTFDIVEFRKLILGIYPEMPNNKSWRFVDSSFVFPNPLNPFQTSFPDSIPIGNTPPYQFIGIKVGDVNLTSSPNAQAPASERFEGIVYFDTEERQVQENEVFELRFTASTPVEACQFTLETDALEMLEIIPGPQMSQEHFAWFPQQSMLSMAWETGGKPEFTLKMKALKAGALREMLRISDQITKAAAYTARPNAPTVTERLALRFGNAVTSFELFQNQPNPFEQQTAITFQLPEASPAVLTVFDGTGKILWINSKDWPAGLNTVQVDLTALGAAGVLYYKLETPERSAVRKMIRM
jgi:hypothetical protein